MESIEVYAIRSNKIVEFGDDIVDIFIESINEEGFSLKDKDIVSITSKIVSMQQKAAVKISDIIPSEQAKKLAQTSKMDPKLAQIVIDESGNQIYGAVFHAILAKTPYGLSANAGIDMSNAPEGYTLLLPRDPDKEARRIRKRINKEFDVDIAVIIIDSRTIPLRMGTTAVALGVAGMEPIIDERGKDDLYGHKMTITTRAIADNVANSTNMLMGETDERTPFGILRGMKYKSGEDVSMKSTLMPEDQCLYFAPLMKLIQESDKNE